MGPGNQVLPQQLGRQMTLGRHILYRRHDQRQRGLVQERGHMRGDARGQLAIDQGGGQCSGIKNCLVAHAGGLADRLQGVLLTLARTRIQVDAHQIQECYQLGRTQVYQGAVFELVDGRA